MNNFMGTFSTTGICGFSKKSFSRQTFSLNLFFQMFLFIIGFGVVRVSLAVEHSGLQITDIMQSPGNPVTSGDTVRYTLTVDNINAQSTMFADIQITSAGRNISGSFTSDECSDDGYGIAFYCPNGINAGQSAQYTFTWQPAVGQHDLAFAVGCSPDCQGESQSITTNVALASSGTLQFSSADYQVGEQDGQVAITVTRTGGSAGMLAVRIVTGETGDTASAEDYFFPPSEVPDELFWSDGDMTDKTLDINIVADALVEGDETLTLQLQDISAQPSPLGSPSQATLLIQDSTVAPPTVEQLNTVSGNFQRGASGVTLEPFVINAVDASGNPVEGVSVDWEILPASGGTLPQLTTMTDASGQSSNTLSLDTSSRVVVKATVGSSGAGGDAMNYNNPVSVIFLVNGSIADQPGLSKNQRSMAKAMDTMCTALEEMDATGGPQSAGQVDLLATCRRLGGEDSAAAVAESLDLLSQQKVSAQGRMIIETAKLQSANIHRRLTALRMGARGVNLSGLNIQVDGQTLPESVVSTLFGGSAQGGSAGEEQQGIASRWGTFVNANIIIGDRDKTGQESGFNFRARGVTAGADYRLSDKLVVGGALGYASNNSDFKGDAGNLEIDNWNLTAYGSYYRSEAFYLDGLFKVGRNAIDTRRRINLPGDPLQEGVGDTTSWEYAASLSAGYEYNRNALTVGPYGRLGYIQTTINGYNESASNPGGIGAGSILTIDNQTVDSITAVLGGQATYAISARNSVYLLQLNGEWEHEFRDNSRAIAAQFTYDPTRTSFNIDSDSPDRNYFNLGLGVTAVFANGRSGFIHYESRLGQDDVRQYWINGGIRIEL